MNGLKFSLLIKWQDKPHGETHLTTFRETIFLFEFRGFSIKGKIVNLVFLFVLDFDFGFLII